jgi:hypothetical protein
LPLIDLPAQPVEKPGLCDQELDLRERAFLRFQSNAREPLQPCRQIQPFIRIV